MCKQSNPLTSFSKCARKCVINPGPHTLFSKYVNNPELHSLLIMCVHNPGAHTLFSKYVNNPELHSLLSMCVHNPGAHTLFSACVNNPTPVLWLVNI